MIKFETGNTYATRLINDHTVKLAYRVISRTAKRMTFVQVDEYGEDMDSPITRAVHQFEGHEICGVNGINTQGGIMLNSENRYSQPLMR